MKERPILFSAPMVRALLDGSKTQTRRVLTQAVGPSLSVGIEDEPGVAELSWLHGDGPGHDVHETIKRVPCRYGLPGDHLWVREAIRLVPGQGPDDGERRVLSTYDADGAPTWADAWPWKRAYLPPMHCPRGLSRITLEVVDVRVERLNDISYEDAIAEGITDPATIPEFPAALERGETVVEYCRRKAWPQRQYRDLWESISGPGTWDVNPWVWVVEFKRVQAE